MWEKRGERGVAEEGLHTIFWGFWAFGERIFVFGVRTDKEGETTDFGERREMSLGKAFGEYGESFLVKRWFVRETELSGDFGEEIGGSKKRKSRLGEGGAGWWFR